DKCSRIGAEKPGDLSVKITADVGEAISGFKALQRELRETTKVVREYEKAIENIPMHIGDDGLSVSADYEEVGKAVKSVITVRELQSQALKDAVWCEENIPDKLRKSILAKF